MKISGIEQNFYLLGKTAEYVHLENLLDYVSEIIDRDTLINKIEEQVLHEPTFETKKFSSIFDFRFFRVLLYILIRATQPETVVETGVMHGLSSSFFLAALEKNGKGRLISIDAPSYYETGPINKDGYNQTLPPTRNSGWIVPQSIRKSWNLRLGRTNELLPIIAKETEPWDIFCHDSEHTYETMWFELDVAWKTLKKGGILICDNIDANSAFVDFCKKVSITPLLLPAPDSTFSNHIRFGLVIK